VGTGAAVSALGAGAAFSCSKNRQRLGTLDDDPRAPADEGEAEEVFHQFPATEDGVVEVCVELGPVILTDEAGETRVPKTPARVLPQAETEGRTTTEVEQGAKHSGISEIWCRFFKGKLATFLFFTPFFSNSSTTMHHFQYSGHFAARHYLVINIHGCES
jgi:hypothetical protein